MLEAAINDRDRNLGIADNDVANYSLPDDWSGCDREQRAKLLADWLANELRYMAA